MLTLMIITMNVWFLLHIAAFYYIIDEMAVDEDLGLIGRGFITIIAILGLYSINYLLMCVIGG